MVTVRTWQDAVGGGLLCIGCLESRLGRELTPDDFSHAFINQGAYGRSPRLRAWLTGKAFLHTNRLPRARALRNFIDQLGIVVKVRSDRRPLPADLSCTISLRRGRFSNRVSLPVGWTTREHAVEMLDRRAQSRPRPDDTPSFRRYLLRRAGRAEMIIQQIFTPGERERFQSLCRLPSADHVLPRPPDPWLLAFFAAPS